MCSEKRFEELEKDVKLILTNHLPHIQVEVEKVKTELRIYGAIIMIALGVIIRMVMLQ